MLCACPLLCFTSITYDANCSLKIHRSCSDELSAINLQLKYKFMSPPLAVFCRKRIVFQWVQVHLAWSSALSVWQFETPYSQIRKIRFPFSIFLTAQNVLLSLVPMASSRLFSLNVTCHLRTVDDSLNDKNLQH